jgi:tetratricopeptide (TPR) repeat protein
MTPGKKRIILQQHHWQAGDLDVIRAMMDKGQWAEAHKLLTHYLNDFPDDQRALFLLGRIFVSTDRQAEGRVVYEYLRNQYPERTDIKLNLGKCYDLLMDWETSGRLYREVLEIEPDNLKAILGLSTIAVQEHRPEEAIALADKALELDPQAVQALSNKSFAHLQQRNFGEGWKFYEYGAGHLRWRDVKQYNEEPRWHGELGKDVHLIVHTEQGIGDQIAGIEPLIDAMEHVTIVGLDADPKMRPMFRRSFPQIPFHGTEEILAAIGRGDIKPTHSCGIFSLHTAFRHSEGDYRKQPYLLADPGLRAMYRGWLDSLDGPGLRIGLCLTGGHTLTHKAARNLPLDALMPILRRDHTFVSLEYQDRREVFEDFESRKGIHIHTNPHIVANTTFEEPAALIAELDLVIGVPTAAMHGCGALGTPAFCMVHRTPNIHYSNFGELMPYYGSVRMFRRDDETRWVESVAAVAQALDEFQQIRMAA